PVKDTKLTPRITQTAKALWYIYLGITVACALAYWLAGMSAFDAVCHSFATVAIGGFSTHDASLAQYDIPAVHLVAIVFMLVSAVIFSLHFMSWRARSLRHYFGDAEFRTYSAFLTVLSATVIVYLLWTRQYPATAEA